MARRFSGVGGATNLSVIVSGINNLGPGLAHARTDVNQFVRHVSTKQQKMDRVLKTSRGNWVYWAAGIAAASIAAESYFVRAATTIQTEWTNVTTLLPHATQEMTDRMKKSLLEQATFVGVDWMDAINSSYQTVSAVFTAPIDQRRMLVASENLARAIKIPLGEATRLIIAGANAFEEGSDQFSRISDLYTVGIRYGVTTGEEMVATLAKVLPMAKALGYGLEEVVAAHAALTNAGLDSAEAAVNQRQMYVQLLQVAQDVGKQFKLIYGLSPKQFVANGASFLELMEAVEHVSQKSGQAYAELFGRVQASTAAQILTSQRGMEIVGLAIEDTADAAQIAANKVRETVQYQLDRMNANYKKAVVDMGESLMPLHLGFKRLGLTITDAIGISDTDEVRARGALLKFNAIMDESEGLTWRNQEALEELVTTVDDFTKSIGHSTTEFDNWREGLAAFRAAVSTDIQTFDNENEVYRILFGLNPNTIQKVLDELESGEAFGASASLFEFAEKAMSGDFGYDAFDAGETPFSSRAREGWRESVELIASIRRELELTGATTEDITQFFDVLSDAAGTVSDQLDTDFVVAWEQVSTVMGKAVEHGFNYNDVLTELMEHLQNTGDWKVFNAELERYTTILEQRALWVNSEFVEDLELIGRSAANTAGDIDGLTEAVYEYSEQLIATSYTDRLIDQLTGTGGLAGGELGNVMETRAEINKRWWSRHNEDLAKNVFDFNTAWMDAQWSHRIGIYDQEFDQEKEFQEWKRRELEQTNEYYNIIIDRINEVKYGTEDWINLQVTANNLLDHAEEVYNMIASSGFDVGAAYDSEQFSRGTGRYANAFDSGNYLAHGDYITRQDEILRARLLDIQHLSKGLSGQDLFSNQSEQRRILDELYSLGQMSPPDKRTALGASQKEQWDIEDLMHDLGNIGTGDYLNILKNRQGFWKAVGLETEVLRIERQIQQIEERAADDLGRVVASPIVKAIEEVNDTLRDGFGRIIEVSPGTDSRGRAVAGMGLEYAATRNRSRMPITTRR